MNFGTIWKLFRYSSKSENENYSDLASCAESPQLPAHSCSRQRGPKPTTGLAGKGLDHPDPAREGIASARTARLPERGETAWLSPTRFTWRQTAGRTHCTASRSERDNGVVVQRASPAQRIGMRRRGRIDGGGGFLTPESVQKERGSEGSARHCSNRDEGGSGAALTGPQRRKPGVRRRLRLRLSVR
jgi:hypothetical protein